MKKTAALASTLLAVALLAGHAEANSRKKPAANQPAATRPIASFTNSIGMVFVKVPAGSFTMGTEVNCPKPDAFTSSAAYDKCIASIHENETPARYVMISNDFWIGQFEVTQAQWYAVMGNNPSDFKSDKVGEDSRNFPVENVSWDDAQQFISRLNARDSKQYRLPTEAEWEYACKSGGKDQNYCGGNDLSALAWYDGNSGDRTHRVGTKRPNGLGIYDMSGNVSEWVSDWYGGNYYAQGPGTAIDPAGPARGEIRVLRGGGWFSSPSAVRASNRNNASPDNRHSSIGFRLVSP